MKKKLIAIVCTVAAALIFCLWYTRPQSIERLCPPLEMSECTGIRFYQSFVATEYTETNGAYAYATSNEKEFKPGDPEFEAIMELMQGRKFSVSLANLLPQSTKTHAPQEGDFQFDLYFDFGETLLPDGQKIAGTLLALDNFYGRMELSCSAEGFENRRVTSSGSDAWLREIYDIVK